MLNRYYTTSLIRNETKIKVTNLNKSQNLVGIPPLIATFANLFSAVN